MFCRDAGTLASPLHTNNPQSAFPSPHKPLVGYTIQEEFWEDNVAAIKYSSGQWARSYGSIYHGSTVMRTRQIGGSMSVKFQGSAIKFMGAQGWDHGSFVVNLDGEETTVDGYCCGPNGGSAQVVQFEATGLSTAEQVLNVINLAAGPSGTVLEVDALL
ncbi:hypothetical protein B0H10DRAFT_2227461 [Mycena sp. CBHHK59/15]|nr:hypothetical protein B0H10DRAFT_2227461 [Mycena sp. CBHHK59/15]